MKKEIKISVIIPFYNAENYFEKCLDSVVNQTLNEIEIICINDGSEDDSVNILNKYATNDKRFITLFQNNKGAGPARNIGISTSKGEYLAFMDADDYYPGTNILEKLYEKAKISKSMICGGNLAIDINEKTINASIPNSRFNKEKLIEFKEYQNDYWFYRYIYKTTFIKENNILFPNYRRFQDPPFLLSAMIKANKFYAIKEITYCYRLNKIKNKNWNNNIMNDIAEGLLFCIALSIKNKLFRNASRHVKEINNELRSNIINTLLNDNKELQMTMQKILKQIEDPDFINNVYYADIEEPIKYLIKNDNIHDIKLTKNMFYVNFEETNKTLKKINKCVRDNGIKYTIERILFHLHLAKDNDVIRTYYKNLK